MFSKRIRNLYLKFSVIELVVVDVVAPGHLINWEGEVYEKRSVTSQ